MDQVTECCKCLYNCYLFIRPYNLLTQTLTKAISYAHIAVLHHWLLADLFSAVTDAVADRHAYVLFLIPFDYVDGHFNLVNL